MKEDNIYIIEEVESLARILSRSLETQQEKVNAQDVSMEICGVSAE